MLGAAPGLLPAAATNGLAQLAVVDEFVLRVRSMLLSNLWAPTSCGLLAAAAHSVTAPTAEARSMRLLENE